MCKIYSLCYYTLIDINNLYYYLKGFSGLDHIFFIPKYPYNLGKNTSLTSTKTLPKKQDYSPDGF